MFVCDCRHVNTENKKVDISVIYSSVKIKWLIQDRWCDKIEDWGVYYTQTAYKRKKNNFMMLCRTRSLIQSEEKVLHTLLLPIWHTSSAWSVLSALLLLLCHGDFYTYDSPSAHAADALLQHITVCLFSVLICNPGSVILVPLQVSSSCCLSFYFFVNLWVVRLRT